MRQAFTLVEILVALAVITILATLGSSVAVRAVERGKLTDELSQLRQLAAAQAMYLEAYDSPATRADQLVSARLSPTSLLFSKADPFPMGIRNLQVGRDPYRTVEPEKFPITYMGPGDFGYTAREVAGWQFSGRNAGWLVSLTRSQIRADGPICGEGGTYRRLLFDGSVQTRPAGMHPLPGGEFGCTTESRFRDKEGS